MFRASDEGFSSTLVSETRAVDKISHFYCKMRPHSFWITLSFEFKWTTQRICQYLRSFYSYTQSFPLIILLLVANLLKAKFGAGRVLKPSLMVCSRALVEQFSLQRGQPRRVWLLALLHLQAQKNLSVGCAVLHRIGKQVKQNAGVDAPISAQIFGTHYLFFGLNYYF